MQLHVTFHHPDENAKLHFGKLPGANFKTHDLLIANQTVNMVDNGDHAAAMNVENRSQDTISSTALSQCCALSLAAGYYAIGACKITTEVQFVEADLNRQVLCKLDRKNK